MTPLKFVWMLFVPLIYPVVSLPIMLIGMIARPLQLIYVVITTALYAFDLRVASAFVIVAASYYAWTVFVPPKDYAGYSQWVANRASSFTGKLSQVVFMAGLLCGVLIGMETLTSISPVLRWLLSFGLAYYFSGVVMSYLNVPDMIAQDRALRRFGA